MKPFVTIAYGRVALDAEARLPAWTTPFVVRVAEDIRAEADNDGVALTVHQGGDGATLTDASPDGFAREFGTLEEPAAPVLQPILARYGGGGL